MKKRIIIIGDSFSLGVGSEFPNVLSEVHEACPKIRQDFLEEFEKVSGLFYEEIKDAPHKLPGEELENKYNSLYEEYLEWRNAVLATDLWSLQKERGVEETLNLDVGMITDRYRYTKYPHTWSSVLNNLLDDVEVINLSRGGYSMGSVLSSLCTWIELNNDHAEYETCVFFQCPDPARKQFFATTKPVITNGEEFDRRVDHLGDYNISAMREVSMPDESGKFNIESHSLWYIEKNLYIGEWFQNIYSMQNICKANGFNYVWCSTMIPHGDIKSNRQKAYPNVLGLNLNWNRNIQQIDPEFASLTHKHMKLAFQNLADVGEMMSGCRHYSRKTQKLFALYLANSLNQHENFWWKKG